MLYRFIPLCLALFLLAGCSATNKVATNPIPPLDPKGDVYKTEGPNDPLIYDDTVGTKKAIVVFCDFPDRRAGDETTQQRAEKTLGGAAEDGTFHRIFKTNSYGKYKLDITVVHGWRTMPESYKLADPRTTQGHRKMFEQAFALYPEIDFSEYDVPLVLMTAKGNFAFGERDDEAIPYRGKKINVAVTQSSRSPYVLAHEFAHCMGLPDLYTYVDRAPEGSPRNPLGPWDIMSSAGSATGFIGWHRHKFNWLDADRKTYLTQGTHTFTLTPLSSDEGLSMIVVPAPGEDAANPSKVYVVEVAQYLRPGKTMPRPRGVLVYSIDAKLPTGINPAVVYPREDKTNAAYHASDTFTADDAPLSLRVIEKNDDDSYLVEVTVK